MDSRALAQDLQHALPGRQHVRLRDGTCRGRGHGVPGQHGNQRLQLGGGAEQGLRNLEPAINDLGERRLNSGLKEVLVGDPRGVDGDRVTRGERLPRLGCTTQKPLEAATASQHDAPRLVLPPLERPQDVTASRCQEALHECSVRGSSARGLHRRAARGGGERARHRRTRPPRGPRLQPPNQALQLGRHFVTIVKPDVLQHLQGPQAVSALHVALDGAHLGFTNGAK